MQEETERFNCREELCSDRAASGVSSSPASYSSALFRFGSTVLCSFACLSIFMYILRACMFLNMFVYVLCECIYCS